MIAASVMR